MLPVWSGAAAPLTQKLSHLIPLAADEIRQLGELQSDGRFFRRGEEVIVAGKSDRTLFVILDGFACRYRLLSDERRQVLNVVLPGDIAGAPDSSFESALYSVRAITDLWASPVEFGGVMDLLRRHPKLAAKMFWLFSCEAAIYAERLITVGRRTALNRVAHFLLELLTRLQMVGLGDERSFRLPVSQALIADALGLTVPYVNQVLRSLREDNLVCIEDKVVTINDVAALSVLVDFNDNYLKPTSITDLLNAPA